MPNDGTGLAYDQARYYDPSLQRFISPDPLGFGGGSLNLYSYVGNSPTNATDPSGTGPIAQCVVGAAFQVGFGAVGSALSGRKYTWGNALGDAATGCVFGALDPGAFGGEIGEAAGAVERGLGDAGEAGAEPQAAALGNRYHYDQLNGATGSQLPSQLQDRYPDTEWFFPGRGQSGADAQVMGGTHPSQYPGSDWAEGANSGDFKPDTPRGARTFRHEIRNGKLPPDTVPLPYDPATGKLKGNYMFGPFGSP